MSLEIRDSISEMASSVGSYNSSGDLATPEYSFSTELGDPVNLLMMKNTIRKAVRIRMACNICSDSMIT
ncbi:MAG: hypothetical protein VX708_02840 [Candidatus Thermoplasmatota archaeon]|nr:hypothetical protein [Candidatus Thermoplasmatota archaeon]